MSSVAEALVKLGSVTLSSRGMQIVRVPVQSQTDDDAERLPIEDQSTRVLVSGVDSKLTKEVLENYFENKRRSGGGRTKMVTLIPEENKAVIEFEDSSGKYQGRLLIFYPVPKTKT